MRNPRRQRPADIGRYCTAARAFRRSAGAPTPCLRSKRMGVRITPGRAPTPLILITLVSIGPCNPSCFQTDRVLGHHGTSGHDISSSLLGQLQRQLEVLVQTCDEIFDGVLDEEIRDHTARGIVVSTDGKVAVMPEY